MNFQSRHVAAAIALHLVIFLLLFASAFFQRKIEPPKVIEASIVNLPGPAATAPVAAPAEPTPEPPKPEPPKPEPPKPKPTPPKPDPEKVKREQEKKLEEQKKKEEQRVVEEQKRKMREQEEQKKKEELKLAAEAERKRIEEEKKSRKPKRGSRRDCRAAKSCGSRRAPAHDRQGEGAARRKKPLREAEKNAAATLCSPATSQGNRRVPDEGHWGQIRPTLPRFGSPARHPKISGHLKFISTEDLKSEKSSHLGNKCGTFVKRPVKRRETPPPTGGFFSFRVFPPSPRIWAEPKGEKLLSL